MSRKWKCIVTLGILWQFVFTPIAFIHDFPCLSLDVARVAYALVGVVGLAVFSGFLLGEIVFTTKPEALSEKSTTSN